MTQKYPQETYEPSNELVTEAKRVIDNFYVRGLLYRIKDGEDEIISLLKREFKYGTVVSNNDVKLERALKQAAEDKLDAMNDHQAERHMEHAEAVGKLIDAYS